MIHAVPAPKLYYFTYSFPYGFGQTWKLNELRVFREYFEHISVIPYSYGGRSRNRMPLPQGVLLEEPLFEDAGVPISKHSFLQLVGRGTPYFAREFCRSRVFLHRNKLRSWLVASLQIKRLLAHPRIRFIIREADDQTILYFFWGRGACDFVPFIHTLRRPFTVARMHRYDLYEYASGGYIPYRSPLLKGLDVVAPCSQDGVDYLRHRYPHAKARIMLSRLGVVGESQSRASADGILRIVTCSNLVPVKRISLLMEALSMLDVPTMWTHLGDGPLMREVKERVHTMPKNITVRLEGMVESTKVLAYYREHPVDLFVNVSQSEGVPISIMEALSAGIPVVATDVGGTREIVDDSVGRLVPAGISAAELAQEMELFRHKTEKERQLLRTNAFRRYAATCDVEVHTRQMAEFLTRVLRDRLSCR